jgi:hypothetical protein
VPPALSEAFELVPLALTLARLFAVDVWLVLPVRFLPLVDLLEAMTIAGAEFKAKASGKNEVAGTELQND